MADYEKKESKMLLGFPRSLLVFDSQVIKNKNNQSFQDENTPNNIFGKDITF